MPVSSGADLTGCPPILEVFGFASTPPTASQTYHAPALNQYLLQDKSMNALKTAATALLTTSVSLGVMTAAHAQYETFEISPGFTPDPLVGSGVSGGPDEVDGCGFIDTADSPDHVLYVNDYFDYLRVSVESPGDVTLFMEDIETGETICVDDSNGTLLPEFAGEWPAGTYFLWIGDFDGGAYPYDIYISEF